MCNVCSAYMWVYCKFLGDFLGFCYWHCFISFDIVNNDDDDDYIPVDNVNLYCIGQKLHWTNERPHIQMKWPEPNWDIEPYTRNGFFDVARDDFLMDQDNTENVLCNIWLKPFWQNGRVVIELIETEKLSKCPIVQHKLCMLKTTWNVLIGCVLRLCCPAFLQPFPTSRILFYRQIHILILLVDVCVCVCSFVRSFIWTCLSFNLK